MPIYNYNCDAHGEFEVQQSIKDPPLDRCPKCIKEDIAVYRCKYCNSVFQITTDEAKKLYYDSENDWIICSHCGAEIPPAKPKKLISLSSFVLKGGGWANEGYK